MSAPSLTPSALPAIQEALLLALDALERFTSEMTVGERYTNLGQYALDALQPCRDAVAALTPSDAAAETEKSKSDKANLTSHAGQAPTVIEDRAKGYHLFTVTNAAYSPHLSFMAQTPQEAAQRHMAEWKTRPTAYALVMLDEQGHWHSFESSQRIATASISKETA